MKKLGIAGCGFLLREAVLDAIISGGDFDVALVFDPDPGQFAFLRNLPESCIKTDSAADIWRCPLDALYIATPNAFHSEYAIKALRSGIGVMVEKPLAASVAQARSIFEAAAITKTPAMVGYMAKFNSYNRKALSLIRSGAIGKPCRMSASFEICGGQNLAAWRADPALAGSGVLADLGIYPVSAAVDIFQNKPLTCSASAYSSSPSVTDAYFSGTMQFPGGCSLSFNVSCLNENPGDRSRISYTVIGENGLIMAEMTWAMDGNGKLFLWKDGRREEFFPDIINPYSAEFHILAEAIDGKAVPDFVSVGRGWEDMMLLDALKRSSIENKTIILEK